MTPPDTTVGRDQHNLSGDFREATLNLQSIVGGSPPPGPGPADIPDEIPAPAPPPPGSRLPFAANPLFVGRQTDLRRLAGHLKHLQTGQAVAITGMGGLGKSQLAVELAHRYNPYFPGGVFWLSLAEAANIPAEIATCGGPDGLNLYPLHTTLSLAEQVAEVWRVWRDPCVSS